MIYTSYIQYAIGSRVPVSSAQVATSRANWATSQTSPARGAQVWRFCGMDINPFFIGLHWGLLHLSIQYLVLWFYYGYY